MLLLLCLLLFFPQSLYSTLLTCLPEMKWKPCLENEWIKEWSDRLWSFWNTLSYLIDINCSILGKEIYYEDFWLFVCFHHTLPVCYLDFWWTPENGKRCFDTLTLLPFVSFLANFLSQAFCPSYQPLANDPTRYF